MKRLLYPFLVVLSVLLGIPRAEAQVIYDVQTPLNYKATVLARQISSVPKFYNVQIKESTASTWKNLVYTKQQVLPGSGNLTFTVDSLLSGTNYDVRIKGEDTAGVVTYSSPYFFTSRYVESNPVVVTLPATNQKRTGVWLRGNWSMGQGKGYFMYRLNNQGSWIETPKMNFYGAAKDSMQFLAVSPGTLIAYKAVGENSVNIVDGVVQITSSLPALPPSIASVLVLETKTTKATVQIRFNPNASVTRVRIESRSFGGMYSVGNDTTLLYGGENDTTVTYTLAVDSPNTVYEARVTVVNAMGSSSSEFNFTTAVLPDPPTVLLYTPEQTGTSIIFKGAVNPSGSITKVKFCYWEELGSPDIPTCTEEITVPAGTSFVNVSIPVPITNFVYLKTYFVNLEATNEGGTASSLINAPFVPSFVLGINEQEIRTWKDGYVVVTDMQGRIIEEHDATDLTFVPKGHPSGMYVSTFIKEGVKTIKKKTIIQ